MAEIAILVGALAVYVWVHFYTIQFTKTWTERNGYERFITIMALVLFVLYIIGSNS